MFARVATVFSLSLLAAANVVPTTTPASQCNTGGLYCCNSAQSATDPTTAFLAGLLGAALGPLDLLAGLGCNPISVIGAGGNSCSAQPVCCTGNNFSNGVLVIGCSPANLNL